MSEREAETSEPAVEALASPRRRWARRMLAGFGLVLIFLLAVVWLARERIANSIIAGKLEDLGIPGSYEIESIGPRRQILRNVVIGDPRHPDMTIARATVSFEPRFGVPVLGKVRLEVRLDDLGDDHQAQPPEPGADAGQVRPGQEPAAGADADGSDATLRGEVARIRVLNGAAAGREVLLTRDRTTIGKPGVLVVAIERVGASHLISLVEGMRSPNVNGRTIGSLGLALVDGDVIELAGTQIAFIAP